MSRHCTSCGTRSRPGFTPVKLRVHWRALRCCDHQWCDSMYLTSLMVPVLTYLLSRNRCDQVVASRPVSIQLSSGTDYCEVARQRAPRVRSGRFWTSAQVITLFGDGFRFHNRHPLAAAELAARLHQVSPSGAAALQLCETPRCTAARPVEVEADQLELVRGVVPEGLCPSSAARCVDPRREELAREPRPFHASHVPSPARGTCLPAPTTVRATVGASGQGAQFAAAPAHRRRPLAASPVVRQIQDGPADLNPRAAAPRSPRGSKRVQRGWR
jgi:hypothetical protein